MSDVITGVPVPDTTYYNVYVGLLTIPISILNVEIIDHTAILIGAEKSIRFAENWLLAANLGIYTDNSNTKKHASAASIDGGLIFDGTIGWEAVSLMNNNASLILMGGIGEFLSPQLNFSVYGKFGIKMTIGQMLTFNIHSYSLVSGNANIEEPDATGEASKLSGTPTSITFGFQF